MQVAHGVGVLDDAVAVLVGAAVDEALLEAAAGEPEAEAVGVVVAAVGPLHERGAAELAGEDDQGLVEQAAGAQVPDEGGDRLVDGERVGGVPLLQLRVLVPRVGGLAHAVGADHGQLDEPDAALDEAPRHQALAPVGGRGGVGRVEAVELLRRFRLAAQVGQLGHRGLHAVGDFVVVDGRLDARLAVGAVEEPPVEVADEREPRPLLGVGPGGPDVVQRLGVPGVDERALVDGGQEAVAEDVDPPERDAPAAEDDEPRQVLVLGPQTVGDPGPHAREAGERHAAVEVEVRLGVLHERRGHRADDGQFVGDAADVREERADRDAALAVAGERPRTRPDVAVLVEHRPFGLERHRPARLGRQTRLRVERVDVRQPAGHVAEDDVSDPGREVGRPGGQRTVFGAGPGGRPGPGASLGRPGVGGVGQQRREREPAEAGGRLAQHLAARQKRVRSGMAAWV